MWFFRLFLLIGIFSCHDKVITLQFQTPNVRLISRLDFEESSLFDILVIICSIVSLYFLSSILVEHFR